MTGSAAQLQGAGRERDSTIDVAKGLAILLVVFAHNPLLMTGEGLLQRVVYALPLPMFLAISGMYFRDAMPLPALLRSRAASLLKPYFVVLLGLAGLKLLMLWLKPGQDLAPLDPGYVAGIFYATGPTIDWTPLWYLPSLFVASLCLWAILRLAPWRSPPAMVATSLGLLVAGVLAIERGWPAGICAAQGSATAALPGWPWSLDLAPITTSFMLLGHALAPWLKSLRFNAAVFALALAAFAAAQLAGEQALDLNCRSYGNPLLSTLQVLTGGYLLLSLAWLLARVPACGRALAYVGTGTIFILLFHAYIAGTSIGWLAARPLALPWAAGLSFAAAALIPLAVMALARRNVFLRTLLLPGGSAHRQGRQRNDAHR